MIYFQIPRGDTPSNREAFVWTPPDTLSIPAGPEGDLILYGRMLIRSTSEFLGPNGKIGAICNAMNCQNCHLDAGTRLNGNSFSAVAATYPTFRPRSGKLESIEFRVNDCLRRSMNGKTIDSLSREMRAMVAYLKWLGKGVPKGIRPRGSGTVELPYLSRPADKLKGKLVYESQCKVCHGNNGQGLRKNGGGFTYPPLWGDESYNTGAGLYRLSKFAGFVRYNMPFGKTTDGPVLTEEEAWDVAAFVNSQPRVEKPFPEDWPNVQLKAVDYPRGPYADTFSEITHKYGPFGPIKRAQDSLIHAKK